MLGRKVTGGVFAAALAMFAGANVATAEDRQFGYALTITGSSDYLFRGITMTDHKPTANVYTEVSYGILYGALWTSTLDTGSLGPWEQDIMVGIRPVTGPVSWDLQALWYVFGNRDHGPYGSVSDTDYFEFKIGATTEIRTGLTIGANVYLTPDQGYAATDNISVEGTISYDLPKFGIFAPQFSGLVGYSDSGTNRYFETGYWLGEQSYTYWNAGIKVNVDKFFMDFRYSGTDLNHADADDRFVFSAGVNLLP
ncbi:TorF family putative porin [Hyphomicrobium sp.]|uniref:TorF family putative porin n=1 Tax=Hyphomicrobium sp. TaxID=82 RepID=UPI002D767F05|nr:TorF family putative porin [Hyphomicrobium sp.]HET6389515.1 TorF family putative porin [Hyphomicrobium sp.]